MSAPLIIPAFATRACDGPVTPAPAAAEPVDHDSWFPGVDLTALRAQARLRESVTPERLREAVLSALIWVGDQLADWQAAQIAAGYTTLAAVPATTIMGESRKIILYRQAVTAWTKALAVERYRDTDLTGAGDRRVEDLDPSVGELRRDAIHAIRAILGRTRTDVELI
ncbi:head completion/stabilization protein [Sphingomonas phyllosphaerae]|uniref:head completion/stabilization protein n=1 Tax=Sphingomonas phyllosphaerae TaxID=257003 RepID=UPI0004013465|nr:head completion/stabilization protein [Sphingomonas phyllosphaerae]